ncbi:unnamed protein product [Lepeophtheirus salmonis]|uniref:(salmon louse) hypothetical protein n=1 Tax=Lepeophtheirus salmonis TaxID=72036 RepID=A0A7R8GZ75_LEPSM|nr:unnamed protein product [Lepeophtheirus salmonis]CAF2749543.1 unnamed protein product [Lepeophtheirus salmonis]
MRYLKQLLSSNSLPGGSSQQVQEPSSPTIPSRVKISSSSQSVKSSNALEAQLDKPTVDSKFSQLPIPKRSLSSLASQIPQPTPISTSLISEPKTVPSTVIQLQKNTNTSPVTPLNLPTHPVPQASLSQSNPGSQSKTQIISSQQSQQKGFAMANSTKSPNVTIIQTKQPNTSVISITQQQKPIVSEPSKFPRPCSNVYYKNKFSYLIMS